MLKVTVIILSALCFSGCQDNKKIEAPIENTKNKDIKFSSPIFNITETSQDKLLNSIIVINNVKYRSLSNTITTSSKLLNMETSQKGSITGSFIVISENKPVPHRLALNFNDDAVKIADKTWRFTANKGTNFLTLYKKLSQKFTHVEISIKYGGSGAEES